MTETIQPATDEAIERLSFDEALAELQRTVAELEAGGQPLEESLALYERGVALQQRCDRLLREAELRVQQLVARPAALEAQDVRPDEARGPNEPEPPEADSAGLGRRDVVVEPEHVVRVVAALDPASLLELLVPEASRIRSAVSSTCGVAVAGTAIVRATAVASRRTVPNPGDVRGCRRQGLPLGRRVPTCSIGLLALAERRPAVRLLVGIVR